MTLRPKTPTKHQAGRASMPVLMTGFLVLAVASASFYIPLKVNDINITASAEKAYSLAVDNIYANSSSLLGSVTTGAKKISKIGPFNVFSIEPAILLRITAPIFSLLPLSFISLAGSTVPTSPAPSSTAAKIQQSELKKALDLSSTPILPILNANILPVKTAARPEDALVNIFCSQKIGTLRRTVTGSGVLINKDGTVLTNAHVGEFPLLSETNPNIVCLARYGNPAGGALAIKVAFISPDWVKENGKYINTEGTPQTGKSDFAILKLQLDSKTALRPIDIQKAVPSIGQKVTATAYPADILGVKGVDSSLILQSEDLSITNVYSVGSTPNDVIETSPAAIGQRGSSGGALTNQDKQLIGTVTMTVNASSVSSAANSSNSSTKKIIRAMSIEHTDSELTKYSGISLSDVAKGGSSELMKKFTSDYRAYLTSLLASYLK